jgi:periplasmic protein TonB
MKKVMCILTFLVFTETCFAQKPAVNQNQDVKKLYMNPQIAPSFPGGEEAWQNFVASNLDTKILVKNGAPAGTYTVTVSFIVGMDHVVSDVECKNDPGYGMCEEAIRLIKKSGKWKPGAQDGRILNGFKLQPIIFRIK